MFRSVGGRPPTKAAKLAVPAEPCRAGGTGGREEATEGVSGDQRDRFPAPEEPLLLSGRAETGGGRPEAMLLGGPWATRLCGRESMKVLSELVLRVRALATEDGGPWAAWLCGRESMKVPSESVLRVLALGAPRSLAPLERFEPL